MYRECKKCEKKQIEFECEYDIKGKQVWVYTRKNRHEEKRNCETKWREKDIKCASYCERKGVLYLRESVG